MKSDVRLINLENLDINSLKLPDEKFDCYVICNHTIPDKELLLKLIQGEVKDINVCGKYAGIWEKGSDDICVEYENNGQKPSDWLVTTEESNLDSFINFLAFAHCEYYDDEVMSHDPILLFYDDENGFATVEGFKGDYRISVDGKEATAKFVNDDQADICLK